MPKHKSVYVVVFSVDGERKCYEVEQEIFARLCEGQSGELVTVNGAFFDFGE